MGDRHSGGGPAMTAAPGSIVIVGGGSAGWMTANLLHKAWAKHGTRLSLIESPAIGTIGVGEGSTPYLKAFFQQLGVAESEWMPACSATYKCGISFPGWSSGKREDSYFHPFFSRLDLETGSAYFHNCGMRRRGYAVPAHPDDFFVSAALARHGKAPVPARPLPFEPDYAYHFDAGLLGGFLRDRATALGVRHISDTVEQVELNDSGDISGLTTNRNGRLEADFYIDCSGFSGLLINKALQEPFLSFRGNLFNDRAVAIATPLTSGEALPSLTQSTALKFGWAWRIPLTTRYGNGYVYASDFISEDEAERELRQHLGPAGADADARHLRMRVGRVENHWRNNCLAVGLSQGFIEPLEATALMLIQYSVQRFIECYEQGSFTHLHRKTFNRDVNAMFEGVRDYIVTHYKTNQRTDTEYWITNRENRELSDHLAAILEAWDEGLDFEATLTARTEALAYLRPSWYCILGGMNRFPARLQTPAAGSRIASSSKAHRYCESVSKQFHDHREYLDELYGNA